MTIIDSLLFVLDPKDVDEELLKQPSTLPTEEDDNAGDGGGVLIFPKQLYAIIYNTIMWVEWDLNAVVEAINDSGSAGTKKTLVYKA